MKKYIFIILIVSALFSCGGDGEDLPANNIPSIPSLINPLNDLLCTDNTVIFNWNASSDLDGDIINYTIQVSKDKDFTQIVEDIKIAQTTITLTLDKGKAYYWRVKATDTSNDSSEYSSIFQFYTEGKAVQNYAPFLPELIAPALNSVIQSSAVILKWDAQDFDNDVLTYDVYFGQENPPLQKVGNAQTDSQLSVNVISSTNYYWKVVALDGKGGKTIGQVWNFKTN